jgi:5-methylthioribose kinase
MTLREQAIGDNPEFPWLDAGDIRGVQRLMQRLGWLEDGEPLHRCAPAGDGNMNLTLRLQTDRREFVLKQARPWVERFDHIPAPWNRAQREIAFYRAVSQYGEVGELMPRLIASDTATRTLLLEYLEGDGDFGDLYPRGDAPPPTPSEIETAARFLAGLHDASLGQDPLAFADPEMRALNFAHIYEIPLAHSDTNGDEASGVDLDALEPGLARAAAGLRRNAKYTALVKEIGSRYLEPGPCLLHGDYFPGSWLRTPKGLRVIDPEFCFYGHPEIDLGCAIAHFALAALPAEVPLAFMEHYRAAAVKIKPGDTWVGRFAGVEVMRRLIGVAQLPIPIPQDAAADTGFRRSLLERARKATLEGDYRQLAG